MVAMQQVLSSYSLLAVVPLALPSSVGVTSLYKTAQPLPFSRNINELHAMHDVLLHHFRKMLLRVSTRSCILYLLCTLV